MPAAKPLKLSVAEKERRRSQRVLLRIRTQIHFAANGGQTTVDATTVSVSPRGALLVLPKNLPIETRVVLEHSATRQRVACKVARAAKEMPDGFHTPLEFDSPAPNFWRIVFPPPDGTSGDV